jgi:hypothetical protein
VRDGWIVQCAFVAYRENLHEIADTKGGFFLGFGMMEGGLVMDGVGVLTSDDRCLGGGKYVSVKL